MHAPATTEPINRMREETLTETEYLGASSHHTVLCPHCDILATFPKLQPDECASCARCGKILVRRWSSIKGLPLSYAMSALIMYTLAMLFPFMDITIKGIFSQIKVSYISDVMHADNYTSLAFVFTLFVQALPLMSLVAIALLHASIPIASSARRVLAKYLFLAKSWCMPEIFLVGVLVSFVKLMAYGEIGIGLSFIPYTLFCLLSIKAHQTTDRYYLWKILHPSPEMPEGLEAGKTGMSQAVRSCKCCMAILPMEQSECPRCLSKGSVRTPQSIQWTLSLLLTSLMLYIPANLLPIMITVMLGTEYSSTIFTGVVVLWESGSYPVALIIFIASVLIPCLKMIALGWLCIAASRKTSSSKKNSLMHFIYEMVEFVGRWSMIDIFVIAVLSSLLRMGNLMGVYPAIGGVYFSLVVIFTMISANMFDSRLLWDNSSNLLEKETDSV